jgi:hypothetical protein
MWFPPLFLRNAITDAFFLVDWRIAGPLLKAISSAPVSEEVIAEMTTRYKLLTGLTDGDSSDRAVVSCGKEVPLLLHDPVTLLFSHLTVPPLVDDCG